MSGAARRGEGIREALAGEQRSERRLVSVCAWCPDVYEETLAARSQGVDVTHGMCAVHADVFRSQMDDAPAREATCK